MELTLDPERSLTTEKCPVCDASYVCVTGFVLRDAVAHAVYYAALHGHDDARETWIDVTLAEVVEAGDPRPRITFGCRIGDFGSHGGLGAALTDGALEHADDGAFGRRLTATEALADRRLEEFWAVVDLLLVAEPDVHDHTHS